MDIGGLVILHDEADLALRGPGPVHSGLGSQVHEEAVRRRSQIFGDVESSDASSFLGFSGLRESQCLGFEDGRLDREGGQLNQNRRRVGLGRGGFF